MAEAAVVEERATVPTRFYCHMCNIEINIPNTDFTCPLCAGGFVEELPAAQPGGAGNQGSGSGSQDSVMNVTGFSLADTLGGSLSDALVVGGGGGGGNRFTDLDTLRGEIATLLMSRNGPNVEISIDGGPSAGGGGGGTTRRGNLLTLGGGSGSSTSLGGGGGAGGGTGGGRVRPQNLDRLDNVLLDFLQSISGGDVDTPFGNSQMFFMGNPGDYAWGREGIDTIVTQLLNQMETSGPPPLAKDKIAEIPKVEITANEVERKLQCSVCWEDFRLQEIVRKLPCSHIYHENCIVPWLDLHGTCPICRKSLTDEDGGADAAHMQDGSGMMIGQRNSACPMHRRGGGNNAATSTSAAAAAASSSATTNNAAAAANGAGGGGGGGTSQTQQQQTRNNIFAFDDGNVDLD